MSPYNMIPIVPEPEPTPEPVPAPPMPTDVDCTWTGVMSSVDKKNKGDFDEYKATYDITKDTEQRGTGLSCDGEIPVKLQTYNKEPPGRYKGKGNEITETYTDGVKDSSIRGRVIKRKRI
jgi:hypothetical protein